MPELKRRSISQLVLHLVTYAVLLLCTAVMNSQRNPVPTDPNAPSGKPEHQHAMSTKDIREKLQKGLENKNAAYAGSNIQTSVDDQRVTLTGTVTSELQHEMALQLARAYAENRHIVDKLVVQQ